MYESMSLSPLASSSASVCTFCSLSITFLLFCLRAPPACSCRMVTSEAACSLWNNPNTLRLGCAFQDILFMQLCHPSPLSSPLPGGMPYPGGQVVQVLWCMHRVVQKLEMFLLKINPVHDVTFPVTFPVCKSYGFITLIWFIRTCGGGGEWNCTLVKFVRKFLRFLSFHSICFTFPWVHYSFFRLNICPFSFLLPAF